jgi:hypothetical protein
MYVLEAASNTASRGHTDGQLVIGSCFLKKLSTSTAPKLGKLFGIP